MDSGGPWTWSDRIVRATIKLFQMWNDEVKKDRHGQVTQFYLSWKKKKKTWCGVTEQMESHHICTAKTFSKPSSLLGSFQQTVAYTAGVSQSLLCCVGAKGIPMVTGTTFSFHTKKADKLSTSQNGFFSLARFTKCQPTIHSPTEECQSICQRETKVCFHWVGRCNSTFLQYN